MARGISGMLFFFFKARFRNLSSCLKFEGDAEPILRNGIRRITAKKKKKRLELEIYIHFITGSIDPSLFDSLTSKKSGYNKQNPQQRLRKCRERERGHAEYMPEIRKTKP